MGPSAHASPLDAVLAALDLALFERRDAGILEPIATPPSWFAKSGSRGLLARTTGRDEDLHPFLAHFLHDAERFWSAGRPGRLKSDAWLEGRGDGAEDGFQACALLLPNKRAILTIELVRDFAAERQAPLQAARDSRLHYERLEKEIEKKEVLLHCIVHDLKGPLSGMLGVLSLMKQHELAADRVHELTELGVSQARKQESMIQGILEVFASEVSALEAFERDPARAPDLTRAANNAVEMLRPAYARKAVELVLSIQGAPAQAASAPATTAGSSPTAAISPPVAAISPPTAAISPPVAAISPPVAVVSLNEPLLVVGHPQRLERVLTNLLENALRYSPARSTVEVRIRVEDSLARVAVEDRGPGVSDGVRGQLFEKFVQDPASGGTAGLGLYFCGMNVERWGGRIGCEPHEGGGSRFWFELPRVFRPDARA